MTMETAGAAFAVEVARDVVLVEGPDAAKFLQGQLSQDIERLAPGQSAWSFLLEPAGRVDAWLRVSRLTTERFALDVDGGFAGAVIARLERFKLRTKADLSPVAWRCVAVRGGLASAQDGHAEIAAPAEWPGIEGVDLLGPHVTVPAGRREGSQEAYDALRIDAMVPAMGRELTADVIPAETGVIDRSVSFTKGCYTGQELVARIDSRGGHVPRHLRRLDLDHPVPVGASVDGNERWRVTSVSGRAALAYVGRAIEPGATVAVSWPEGTAGAVVSR